MPKKRRSKMNKNITRATIVEYSINDEKDSTVLGSVNTMINNKITESTPLKAIRRSILP